MRVVSYNILDGGEGRADPIAEVMEAQRPDVVALVEATDAAVVERIASRLKMDHVLAPGRSQASALLSWWTIRESVNHALVRDGLSKSLLEATVVTPAGAEWVVGVAHLHARAGNDDETIRERELGVVLDAFGRHRAGGAAHLLVGDFNANSPVQRIDPEKLKPRTRADWDANGGRLPRRAVRMLLEAGYVDTLAAVHPQLATGTGSFTTRFPGQRVDYIFTHGVDPARMSDAWIEQDRLAKYASDHFPVGLQID